VELWLSTDDNPVNKIKIVHLASYTNFQDWNKSPSQTSAPIALKAGKRYYIEVLQKEGIGGDHLSIGWQLPGNKSEFPIGENRLSPYNPGTPNNVYISSNRQGKEVNETKLSDYSELNVYPNPFTSNATIRVHAEKSGAAKVEVYDLHGRLVKKVFSGWLEGGIVSKYALESSQLTSGVYFIRLTLKSKVINQKITCSK
jgi:hypothetical protein